MDGGEDDSASVTIRLSRLAGTVWSAGVTTSGALLSWGRNEEHQVIGDFPGDVPKIVSVPEGVRMVSVGMSQFAALTYDGRLYTWGSGSDGRLGHGTDESSYKPKLVKALSGERIAFASAGPGCNIVAVSDSGKLFTWGSGANGRLGHGNTDDVYYPKVVEALAGEFVVAAETDKHTVALTGKGQLYSWGPGENGRLGHGRGPTDATCSPRLVTGLLGHRVVNFSVGSGYTGAVDDVWGVGGSVVGPVCSVLTLPADEGRLFMWGTVSGGRLGLSKEKSTKDVLSPTQVTELEGVRIVAVSCGVASTAALTADGEVFTFGTGTEGQLGHGDSGPRFLPKMVTSLRGVVSVSMGEQHSLAVDVRGNLWAWGCGGGGRLGLSGTKTMSSPKRVPKFNPKGNPKFKAVGIIKNRLPDTLCEAGLMRSVDGAQHTSQLTHTPRTPRTPSSSEPEARVRESSHTPVNIADAMAGLSTDVGDPKFGGGSLSLSVLSGSATTSDDSGSTFGGERRRSALSASMEAAADAAVAGGARAPEDFPNPPRAKGGVVWTPVDSTEYRESVLKDGGDDPVITGDEQLDDYDYDSLPTPGPPFLPPLPPTPTFGPQVSATQPPVLVADTPAPASPARPAGGAAGGAAGAAGSGGAVEKETRKQKYERREQRRKTKEEVVDELLASKEILIPPNMLQFKRVIGEGSSGIVYQGELYGTEVAIKRLKGVSMMGANVDWQHEFQTLKSLRHPNIVLFIGVALVPKPLCIVTEYCAHGSLADVIHKHKREIPLRQIHSILKSTASGMSYLHNRVPKIIHRDIKSGNLLLTANWEVKIGDFGLSRVKSEFSTQTQTNAVVGTPLWMAPEVMQGKMYGEKCDVYSYAIVMWELFERKMPFEGMDAVQVMFRVVVSHERPALTKVPDEYVPLITSCWDAEASNRPSFVEIVQQLDDIAQRLRL